MIKISLTFEMDEEQLRDLFSDKEIKFTKKKAKELQEEMDHSIDDVQVEMEERFSEVVEEWIESVFGE